MWLEDVLYGALAKGVNVSLVEIKQESFLHGEQWNPTTLTKLWVS